MRVVVQCLSASSDSISKHALAATNEVTAAGSNGGLTSTQSNPRKSRPASERM